MYSTYIVLYAIASPTLGRYIDSVSKANNSDISPAIFDIAGVHFTVLAVVIISATFIPKGSLAFNPKAISGQTLKGEHSTDDLVNDDTSKTVGNDKVAPVTI